MKEQWAIVCQTVCTGLTMSRDDLYDTKLEADQELLDLQTLFEGDCGFMVIPVLVAADGYITDTFSEAIKVE